MPGKTLDPAQGYAVQAAWPSQNIPMVRMHMCFTNFSLNLRHSSRVCLKLVLWHDALPAPHLPKYKAPTKHKADISISTNSSAPSLLRPAVRNVKLLASNAPVAQQLDRSSDVGWQGAPTYAQSIVPLATATGAYRVPSHQAQSSPQDCKPPAQETGSHGPFQEEDVHT